MTELAQRTPPGPPPRSGGLVESARYMYHFVTDPIGFVGGRFQQYGDVYYAPSGGVGLYVIKHPDHVREVLATRARDWEKKHTAFERLEEWLGSGLLTADGDRWKRHRRMIQPAFHRSRLERYAVVMLEEARRLAAGWRHDQVVDLGREMMELTLRVVSRTLFGHDIGTDTEVFARSMRTFQSSMLGLELPSWMPSPRRRRLQGAIDDLDRVIYRLIDGRSPGQDHDDLLQRLVDAVDDEGDGGRLTRKEVRDELLTMFLAGHETTSIALTWSFYLLGRTPEARGRLDRELDLFDQQPLTPADLERLPWTRQIIEEAMRLYPPAYMVARRAATDTTIGHWQVPAGSEVAVWIYMTHHDRRWYPNPSAFRPERFAPESRALLPKMTYLPFGGGPRACIGAQFAMIEAQLLLAAIAARFHLEPVDRKPAGIRPRITLTPDRPIRMRVCRRSGS